MSLDFEPISGLTGPGEVKSNIELLAQFFPDAVVDGAVDVDVLRDLLGGNAASNTTEAFGLRWPGMAEARRLSTLPATNTLLPKPEESVGWGNTRNLVIEGDNLEVLRLLRRGYTNKVDVIYIDPPYNTGNDFVYDDKRATSQTEHETAAGQRDDEGVLQAGEGSDLAQDRKAGASKHTAWLSMMYSRLLVAHHLLKETGVFIVAIDDIEHARVKLLMDRVFGAENFIANIVWQGGVDGYASYVSVKHDYMLVYAKNKGALDEQGTQWRELSEYATAALEVAHGFWKSSGLDSAIATEMLHKWWKEQIAEDDSAASVAHYDQIDDDGKIFYGGDAGAPVWRSNRCFKPLIHPVTKKPTAVPKNGWRWDETELTRR